MSNSGNLPELMKVFPDINDFVRGDLGVNRATEEINRFLAEQGVNETTSRFSVRRARARLSLNGDELSEITPVGVEKSPRKVVRRQRDVAVWTPGIELDQNGGELRTEPERVSDPSQAVPPEESEILERFGLPATQWQITTMRQSMWQQKGSWLDEDGEEHTEWLRAYKVSFTKRHPGTIPISDEDITAFLSSYPKTPARIENPSDKIFMVPMGDTQIGKVDGGGTDSVVARFAAVTAEIEQQLISWGGVKALILPWLGDCLEGVVSQGGKNVARLDKDLTTQFRIVRRLMEHQIATLAPHAEKVLVPIVGGNHDEAYRMQTMAPTDSWALEAGSTVADLFSRLPGYDHVEFRFPEDEELGVTVQIQGDNPYTIHFEHGHMARSPEKVITWWKDMTHGRQSAGAADMLVTAHFHHYRLQHTGGKRVWLQIPALESGSDWYRRRSGEEASPGVVSMEVVGGSEGVTNLRMHTA